MEDDPIHFIRSKERINHDIEDLKVNPDPKEMETCKQFAFDLLEHSISNYKELRSSMIALRRKYRLSPRNSKLISAMRSHFTDHENFSTLFKLLVTTKRRSFSGVLVVTVVTSPYPDDEFGVKQKFSCKWDCFYCPHEPGQPRSYLHDEPAVLRANQNQFDPVMQFLDRVYALAEKGHPVDKIELIVLGGTWESYPLGYRERFCRDIYYAANTLYEQKRERKSLLDEQKLNENASCKIIGLTLETRPDTITTESIKQLRSYGCTRVQLGVQHTDDHILKKINRQCTTSAVKDSIRLLKNACFKIDIHIMPNLPGSSPEKDDNMFDEILNDADLQADQWKIYPCEIVPWTKIKKWHESGAYVPYGEHELQEVIIRIKSKIHPWIRLNRIIRDIPSQYIVGGVSIPHMRDQILSIMKGRNLQCRCIRCREICDSQFDLQSMKFKCREYKSSGGKEFFLSFEDAGERLVGFLRLRLSDSYTLDSIQGCAMIRELHVYGQMLPTTHTTPLSGKSQHLGFGSRLLVEAERIAQKHGYGRICVISGVGTREYYRKRGYATLNENYYLEKTIPAISSYFEIFFSLSLSIMFIVVGSLGR